MVSKESVNYRPAAWPSAPRRCGTCSMFVPPDSGPVFGAAGTCTLVKGPIDKGYLCDRWDQRQGVSSLPNAP